MQQRGSDHVNVHQDDVMKHDLQGMLRGDHPNRAEEWREAEPGADDDPPLADGPVPPRGAPTTEEAERESFRFELARHLRRTVFPADRDTLLDTLAAEHAPDGLAEPVRDLPADHRYANVQEVVDALGRKPKA
ncbi:DUF2795 domain-containing protein [Streptomyces marincola]|uniref:DUF2795 domain-containing protein n=1 Tax=Streptomyces marincola TaxID=2878388 RepID=UPI001CF24F91|nr:DUF2795 domain-containing protein [Streptomyces marincola]UCM87466.1 DUF2795 domain-containing protein [Streptomyces marincola]